MVANYLHGIETIELLEGPIPVREVKSAVIFLVGTAPVHLSKPTGVSENEWYSQVVNKPILILNEADSIKYFGEDKTGYTIPSALKGIFDMGGSTCIVLNVFDPTIHITTGTPDPTKVQAADIIGTIDPVTGLKTGLKFISEFYSRYGFTAKLLLAPVFCEETTVRTEMITQAENNRAFAIVDAPAGLSVSQVLTARGQGGQLNTSSYRTIICYPKIKVFDPETSQTKLVSLSPRVAGLIAKTDNEDGYWFSPSNRELNGVLGIERHLTAGINDPLSEVNILNENGVFTIFNSFGTGYRAWGNRSAAFPSKTDPKNFISVRRTSDMIAESIEYSTAQHLDKPINITIDAVLSQVNAFIRTLIGRGALIDGSCKFLTDKNPPVNLANGHLTFTYEMMPPTPTERITFEQVININLLNNILGG